MIIDKFLTISNAQAVTVTAEGTNVLDFTNVAPDVGTGEPLYFVVSNPVALASGTADDSVAVTLVSDAASNLGSSPYEESIAVGTFQLAAGALAKGNTFIIRIPPGFPVGRYVGVLYTVGTELTAGAFDAFFTHDIQKWVAKANATNASIDLT